MSDTPASSPAITMQQIADKAGVARSTVSYALRNHPSIPEATRKRIQKIAEKLGYRPDAYVSTLMARLHASRQKSEQAVIALVVEPEVEKHMRQMYFYREVRKGLDARANALGYQIETFLWQPDVMPPARLAAVLHARGIRGILLAPLDDGHHEIDFPFEGFACSTTGFSIKKPELHRVTAHYQQGMELAWAALRERGYKRPGIVMPQAFNTRTQWSYLGTFLARQSMDTGAASLPPCLVEGYSGYDQQLLAWYRKHKPDVVLIASPEVANILGKVVNIPAELGVISLTVGAPSRFSGIRQPDREVGASAVDLIVSQIHRGELGIPPSNTTTMMKFRWEEGETLPPRN